LFTPNSIIAPEPLAEHEKTRFAADESPLPGAYAFRAAGGFFAKHALGQLSAAISLAIARQVEAGREASYA